MRMCWIPPGGGSHGKSTGASMAPKNALRDSRSSATFPRMKTTTVEERLTRIERKFDELRHEVLGLKPLAKSWRQTVGAIPDDKLSRNAEKQGREWREQANKD